MSRTHSDAHILVGMTYVSRAHPDVAAGDVESVLEQARSNNQAVGMTGMLTFNKGFFADGDLCTKPLLP